MAKKFVTKSGSKQPIRKSRKQIRKEQRKEKKLKRSLKNIRKPTQETLRSAGSSITIVPDKTTKKGSDHIKETSITNELLRKNEVTKHGKLQSQMQESRKKQLLAANEDEDRNIRQLEKLLKLNRKKGSKGKSLPKSFSEDGLGYLLEVCDSDMIKDSVKMDQALQDSGSEFEEDLAVVRGKTQGKKRKESPQQTKSGQKASDISDDNASIGSNEDSGSDFGLGADDGSSEEMSLGSDAQDSSDDENNLSLSEEENEDNADLDDDLGNQDKYCVNSSGKRFQPKSSDKKIIPSIKICKEKLKREQTSDLSEGDDASNSDDEEIEGTPRSNNAEIWEDIYGRKRDKGGNVIDEQPSKYIPPALREKMNGNEGTKRKENLMRLRKQMKGLINRLAENNMSSICSQVDELFMKNSRHDMNETLLNLFMDALVSPVLTPERLVMEHMLFVSVLHANVGTEVGAHFLQNVAKKFQEALDSSPEVENKELDNLLLILSHLYNFKVFSASLMYEVLHKISEILDEKRIELILIVLRSVGFSLRKDDPMALKNLILKLQEKAVNCSASSSSRVKFMLDILMAIKNNNMSKIPSYNPEHVEHLKKLLRTLIRRGNYITELKITLDDLLKADERGRWWIVGSAWTGHLPGENPSVKSSVSSDPTKSMKSTEVSYSSELLELARKQRMNTGVRKDIFCILMTAEDYMDAFEKLLHLNLKNQQRQEIVHVLFDCGLQEKVFNPYYAFLAQKFCDFDRQYQMKFQYCLWDKLKELDKVNSTQLSNMAKLLAHLFLEKSLPISALKVMSFAEMDKPSVRLFRQILLIILLADDQSRCEAVFLRVAVSPQLHLFREGLRLFINHFVLRKGSSKALQKQELTLLQDRARIVDKALSSADSRMEF